MTGNVINLAKARDIYTRKPKMKGHKFPRQVCQKCNTLVLMWMLILIDGELICNKCKNPKLSLEEVNYE